MITNNHHLKIKCNVDENAFDYVVVMPLNNVQLAKISIMLERSENHHHLIECNSREDMTEKLLVNASNNNHSLTVLKLSYTNQVFDNFSHFQNE
jgi:hypothetical protein